ncbi:hypothetical protein BKI52_21340 [marine bacterium AO1-C]|nr:hypothetical protein BKI52_21340 [marine bacterium AO1-C]
MNKNILVFGASNSHASINKQFAIYAANELTGVELNIVDLNDYALPLYSVALEKQEGIPQNAKAFSQQIKLCEGIIISLAEYNGLHTTAFKNLWDWLSRMGSPKIWMDKPMLLLSTSPSKRTMSNVLQVSKKLFPFFGANIIADYHLPSFRHSFAEGKIIEPAYKAKFSVALDQFQAFLNNN